MQLQQCINNLGGNLRISLLTLTYKPIILPDYIVSKFNLPCCVVNVEPLKRLVEFQANHELKPAPNLTSKHLQPSHFDKMKVSAALNVFSHSVSSSIKLMVDEGHQTEDALTTAWFLQIVDRRLTLMSSRFPAVALSKFDIDKHAEAVAFWNFVTELFQCLHIGREGYWKPVQSGVTLSMMSSLSLQDTILNQCDYNLY